MKIVFRILAAILFLVFFSFALKNTQEVALQFFMGYELRGPLVLLLLVFFAGGSALGVLAMVPTVFRYRNNAARHHKTIVMMEEAARSDALSRSQLPQPDRIVRYRCKCTTRS